MTTLQRGILVALVGLFYFYHRQIEQLEYEKTIMQNTIDTQWEKLQEINTKIKQDTSHSKCFRIK